MKKIVKKSVATTTKGNQAKAQTQPTKAASKPQSAEASEKKSGANTGRSTGLRVMAFQDLTYETNDQARRPAPLAHIPGQLTDDELAKVWREEFPNSRAVLAGRITGEMVRSVRNLYNQGTGGHGTEGKTHASRPWIIGEGGKRVQGVYTRARKAEDKPETSKTKATVPSAQGARAAAKVVTAKAAQAVKAAGKKVVVKKRSASKAA